MTMMMMMLMMTTTTIVMMERAACLMWQRANRTHTPGVESKCIERVRGSWVHLSHSSKGSDVTSTDPPARLRSCSVSDVCLCPAHCSLLSLTPSSLPLRVGVIPHRYRHRRLNLHCLTPAFCLRCDALAARSAKTEGRANVKAAAKQVDV